jgi:phosphosulfolactate phosphohydrolase-like enzyme
LIEKLRDLSGGEVVAQGDAARAAQDIFAAAKQRGLEETFLTTDNGLCLSRELGLEEDVRFASRVDVFTTVPKVTGTYALDNGERAAVLTAG